MRACLVLLAPARRVGAGGWYTRPGHGRHCGLAGSLMAEGRLARPEQAPAAWAFDNFRVARRSTVTPNERGLRECRGFFTRFRCTGAPLRRTSPFQAEPGRGRDISR